MKYRTIVADPPWEYEEGTGASYSTRGRRDCDLPYPTLTVDEIAALPVNDFADRQSTLFLIRRIVIDLEHGSAARIYIDRFADDETLIPALTAGIRIVDTAEEAGKTTGKGLSKPRKRGKTG